MHKLPRFILAFCLLGALQGVPASQHDASVHLTVTGFDVEGDNPLAEEQTRAVLDPYRGEHTGVARLRQAAAKLEQAIHEAGHPFHRVSLPPQTVDNGRLRIRILAFTLGKVEVSGNQYFSSENIRRSLPALDEGEVPDTQVLAKQLIVANEHPSKQVTARFKKGARPDSVDAELAVQDRRPWQVFAALNNTGSAATGDYRASAGMQHSNLFDRDHAMTLSYTTSPNHTGDVKQFGANYSVPVYPLSGTLSGYYSRSDVDSGTIQDVFDVSGAGRFIGATYSQSLNSLGNYRHKLAITVEDKRFDNNVDFQGIQLGADVRSRPITLAYSGTLRRERSNFSFRVSYVRNLPGGSENDDTSYAATRAGAERSWQALRYTASADFSLASDWLLNATFDGQYASEPLISGEQFGIGGASSVRGFDERAISGDRGQRLSLELWTPPLTYGIRLLGFIDAGRTTIDSPAAGQIDRQTIVSAGVGLRWRWRENLSVNFDYGHALDNADDLNSNGIKTHLSVFYRY